MGDPPQHHDIDSEDKGQQAGLQKDLKGFQHPPWQEGGDGEQEKRWLPLGWSGTIVFAKKWNIYCLILEKQQALSTNLSPRDQDGASVSGKVSITEEEVMICSGWEESWVSRTEKQLLAHQLRMS